MKILLSSESYWPNHDGGAVFERRLVHQLIGAGHQVAVVVPGTSPRSYQEIDGESVIYRTASMPLPFNKGYTVSYYARNQVITAIEEFKPDIIHVHTMALTGASLLKQAKKRGIPIVATNHLMPENVLMSLPSGLMNSALVRTQFWQAIVKFHNQFLAVSVPTESAAVLLRQHHLKPPLSVISNGVNTTYFIPLSTSNQQKLSKELRRFALRAPYALYLGRVNAEKRLDMLLKSYARMNEQQGKNQPLHLVIAGVGNRLSALEYLASELGITDRVHFVGRVSEEEKRALYQHAEFFVITSPAELQSIVTLEAAACGLAIIAVDIVALRELCHDNKNGFLIELDDEKACAEAMKKLHTDEALRARFGAYSRELIVAEHSEEATLREYIAFYEEALERFKKALK